MSVFTKAVDQLTPYIVQRMRAFRNPGLSLSLTGAQHTIHVGAYGFADLEAQTPVSPDTLFQIGSIGKSFTAVAVLQAQERGLLDLHAPVTAYLPWFEVRSRYDGPITLHHLLTHTAGLIEGTDFSPDPRGEVWALREREVGSPPGEQFAMSNLGYKVLGLVLEEVLGQPYGDILKVNIFDPLGMSATAPAITHAVRPRLARGYRHLYDDRPGHVSQPLVPAAWLETNSGDGCIASTAEDMAAYMRMLLNRGQGPAGPVLSEDSYRLLTQRAVAEDEDYYYGYGLYVFEDDGVTYVGHGGDMPGYEAAMWLNLDDGLGATVLMTQPYTPGLAFYALELLHAAATGQPLPEPWPLPDYARVPNAADFAGTYKGARGTLTLRADGERLLLDHDGEPVVLERRGSDRFYVGHPDLDRFLLEFGRADAEGEDEGEGEDEEDDDEEPAVVELFHGPDWYVGEAYDGPAEFSYPAEWDAYTGHYRSHNPWQTNFRVIMRKGELLWVDPDGDEDLLVPPGDGVFRLGEDESSPERLQFDQLAGGRALRANLSGCDYYRFFTP